MDYDSHPMEAVPEINGPATVSFVSVNGDARHYFAVSHAPTSDPVQGEFWWVDSYCNKHDGYHLQRGDDGTDYVFKSIASANEACRALNDVEAGQ